MNDLLKQIADVYLGPQENYSKPVNYIVGGNGIFVVKKTGFGEITVKTDQIPLLDNVKEEFKLNIPKAPYYLFLQAYSFFRDVTIKSKDEAALVLYYNTETKSYELYCPEQTVSGASVKFANDVEYVRRQTDQKYIRVCEMHSHNTMSAFHSGTDDKDEIFDCSFLVFGKLDTKPEHIFSFAASGRRVDSSLWDLFERPVTVIDGPNNTKIEIPMDVVYIQVDYPKEWHNKLKKQVYKSYYDEYVGYDYGKYSKYQQGTIYDYDDYNQLYWWEDPDKLTSKITNSKTKETTTKNTVDTNKHVPANKVSYAFDDEYLEEILYEMQELYGSLFVEDFVNYVAKNKDSILREVIEL